MRAKTVWCIKNLIIYTNYLSVFLYMYVSPFYLRGLRGLRYFGQFRYFGLWTLTLDTYYGPIKQ